MIKYFGILLIFFSLVYFGRYKAYTYRQRHRQLGRFLALLDCIITQIELYNLPLDEIYRRCYKCDDCDRFTELLINGSEFCGALNEIELYINDEERRLLYDFGAALGKSGREEQLKLCRYTIERLKAAYDKCIAELPKQTKLAETLGLLSALMAAVLFV